MFRYFDRNEPVVGYSCMFGHDSHHGLLRNIKECHQLSVSAVIHINRIIFAARRSLPVCTQLQTWHCTATTGAMCQIRKSTDLFNHLVGERQQGRGHDDAERLCGFLIDHQNELARLLNGEIAGLGTTQNFRNIGARMAKAVRKVA